MMICQLVLIEALNIANENFILLRTKGIYQVRNFLKDVFGFAEHHENAAYGRRYKLTLQKIIILKHQNHRSRIGATDASRQAAKETIEGKIPRGDFSS